MSTQKIKTRQYVSSGAGGGVMSISAGTLSASLGSLVFSNSNGLAFGLSGSTITGSYTQNPATSLVFSNSNGVTFGMNAGTLTASVATNYQSPGAYLTTAMASNAGSNFLSTSQSSLFFQTSQSSLLQGSGNYLTTAMLSNAATISNINVSAGASSLNLSAITFSNSNGVTFGLSNNSVLTASVQTNYLTTAAQSNQVVNSFNGKTGQISLNVGSSLSSSTNGSSTTFGLASNITTALQSTGNYLTTAMQSNAATISNIKISAGASSSNVSAVTFSNANGVSFGYDGTNITASVAAAGGAQTGISGIAAGGVTATSGTIIFSNSNGVTFGVNGQTMTASVQTNYLTTAMQSNAATISNINFSAGTTSQNLSALTFSNSNGISFGLSGNSVVTASYTVPNIAGFLTTAAQSNQVVNNLNGSTGQISLNVGSSLSSSTNGSSITFGLASNITTALQSTGAYLTTARGSTDAIGLNTAQTNVTWTVNSSGLSFNAAGYAGTGTSATNASITLNSAGIQISVAAPGGGAAVNFSGGTTSNNLQTLVFSNSNNVSFGLNGSTMTASVRPDGTYSSWQMTGGFISSGFQYGQSILQISGQNIQGYVTGTQINAWVFGSTKSTTNNSTYALTLGMSMGIYTKTGSTLSLASSASFSTNLTNSSNANTVAYGFMRMISGTANINITPGDYWFAILSSTASANQASITISNFGLVNGAAFYQDVFGGAPNASKQLFPGMGSYSTSTNGLPASMAFGDIRAGGGNGFFSGPWMGVLNYTA
jgi:hypothetical protein